MSRISFACQTYSWQMSGERYRGQIDRIAAVAADAGFRGLEPEVFMLGGVPEAQALAGVLGAQDLQLAAVAFAAEWRGERETDPERTEADQVISLLADFPRATAFPGAKLVLVQLPGPDRSHLAVRQRHAISCINAVARRALDAGVQPTVHPNSPPGSLFRVREDYERLLDGIDPQIGFTPDVGHVAAGGMDPLEIIKLHRDRVDHVHFKDIDPDGGWAPTGQGRLDFTGIVSFLAASEYEGWIVFEDESDQARDDPDEATRRNGVYARELLRPLTGEA
jgi:inosose dehydratase